MQTVSIEGFKCLQRIDHKIDSQLNFLTNLCDLGGCTLDAVTKFKVIIN